MRVYPNEKGFLKLDEMPPNSYGRCTAYDNIYPGHAVTFWVITAPNGMQCCIDPKIHQIEEHEDGTLSISPSILISWGKGWHGFLKRGVFTTC